MNQLSKLIYLLGLRTICRPAPGANSSLELALNCRVNAQLCLATPSYTEADGDRDAQLHLHREGSTPSLCGGGPVSRDYSGPELRGRFTTEAGKKHGQVGQQRARQEQRLKSAQRLSCEVCSHRLPGSLNAE